MAFANPDDDPRIWGEDPEWDGRMRLYQAELAREKQQRSEAIRRTIDEVLREAGKGMDTGTIRRRLRQAFGLTP